MAIDFTSLSGARSSLTGGDTPATQNDAGSADRFLKLLVTQMQNQDPLNPLDNAQVTSQMAQINTVSGIEKLNSTVNGLNNQFMQMQSLQAASLIGHDVWLEGNGLRVVAGQGEGLGEGVGAFNLAGPADSVKVEVLNPAGKVVGTVDLGAQGAGRQSFRWAPEGGVSDDAQYTFRVTALSGTKAVASTALMRDHVESVGIDNNSLTLVLSRLGDTAYSKVLAIH